MISGVLLQANHPQALSVKLPVNIKSVPISFTPACTYLYRSNAREPFGLPYLPVNAVQCIEVED